jgi:hypothetical protein
MCVFMSDTWLVRLPSGETRMTLDELDAAYQSDRIDEHTLVREPGAPWRTLGSILGIEPTTTIQSVRPVSIDLEVEPQQPPFESHAKRNLVLGMTGSALVAVGAFVAVIKLGGSEAPKAAAGAAAAVVAAPTIATTAVAVPTVERPVLTDAQKQALVKADQDREKKARDAKESRTKKVAPAPKSKPVFTKSGNKYDPLNAKL